MLSFIFSNTESLLTFGKYWTCPASSCDCLSESIKISFSGISDLPSIVKCFWVAIACIFSTSFSKSWGITESKSSLNCRSKYLCYNSSDTLFRICPSMTRHYRKKSSSTELIPGSIPLKLTSNNPLICETDSKAVGIWWVENVEFILKATFYFLVSSWRGFPRILSSAPSVSKTSCKVWRSESPGKRGRPENISAKIQPTAHTSILSL